MDNTENSLKIYRQISITNDTLGDIREIKSIIEGLLFTAGEPLSLDIISNAIEIDKSFVKRIIEDMKAEFNFQRRGIQIIEFNDKYQLGTRPEHIDYIRKLSKHHTKQSLSRAAIETIAIIAYRQPINRQDIDSIRGVKSDRIIASLLEKKLIKEVGRMDGPGRPILYGTTDEFLRYFGLKNLSELPNIDQFKDI